MKALLWNAIVNAPFPLGYRLTAAFSPMAATYPNTLLRAWVI